MKLVIFDFTGVLTNTHDIKKEDLTILLKTLHQDYTLAIISANEKNYINEILNQEGWGLFFSEVIGYEERGSKREKINFLLAKYQIPKESVFFVTDRVRDIIEAKGAGVKAIAVAWGLEKKSMLIAENPKKLVETPAELLQTLHELL
jgi:phosphoglycolate phosphatase-like HAD superfamily hydrolase